MFRGVFFYRLLGLVILGGVSGLAAPVFWHLRGYDTILPPEIRVPTPVIVAPKPIDIDPILSLAPFGQHHQAPPPNTAAVQNLNMTLLGIILRDDPKKSMALIETPKGESNYRIGDTIDPQAILQEVMQDFVILDIGGTQHQLGFEGALQKNDDSPPPTGADRLAAIMATGVGPSISEQIDQAARRVPVTTQDYINYWRERIRANPAEVLDKIGLVPTENGYMIAQKHDSGVTRAGLREGDIVRTVNGQIVGNVDYLSTEKVIWFYNCTTFLNNVIRIDKTTSLVCYH